MRNTVEFSNEDMNWELHKHSHVLESVKFARCSGREYRAQTLCTYSLPSTKYVNKQRIILINWSSRGNYYLFQHHSHLFLFSMRRRIQHPPHDFCLAFLTVNFFNVATIFSIIAVQGSIFFIPAPWTLASSPILCSYVNSHIKDMPTWQTIHTQHPWAQWHQRNNSKVCHSKQGPLDNYNAVYINSEPSI